MAPASTIPKDPQNSARATGRRTPLQGIILTHNALTRGTPSPQHAGWLPRPVQHAPRASDPAARHHHRPGDLTARRHHRPGDRTPVAWRARMGSCTRGNCLFIFELRLCGTAVQPPDSSVHTTSCANVSFGTKPMPSSRATGRSAEHALLQRHAVQRNHRRYDGVEDVRLEGDQLATSDGGQRVEQQLISTDLPGWRPRFRAARTSCRRTRQ